MSLKRWSGYLFVRSHPAECGVVFLCMSLWLVYLYENLQGSHHVDVQVTQLTESNTTSSSLIPENQPVRDHGHGDIKPPPQYQSVPLEARSDFKVYVETKFNNSCYRPDPKDLSRRILRERSELQARGCKQKLPQAIMIGGRKCRIGRILQFLRFHPAIEMRTSLVPLDFFTGSYKTGLDLYRKQMPYTTISQMTVEKTPEYFIVPNDVPKRVHDEISPDTKIIVVICDPVKRIISDYISLVKRDKMPAEIEEHFSKTFEETVLSRHSGQVNHLNALVDGSLYFKHFMRWLHLFPLDQLILIDAEDIEQHPAGELQRLETFLGLAPYFDESHFSFTDSNHRYCLNFPQNLCIGSNTNIKETKSEPVKDVVAMGIRSGVPQMLKSQLYDYFEPYDQMVDN
ncbi:heparan sulfate glucosamine 3-O-sulfotransferase 1-like [Glandiceps talaboti]